MLYLLPYSKRQRLIHRSKPRPGAHTTLLSAVPLLRFGPVVRGTHGSILPTLRMGTMLSKEGPFRD